MVWFGSPDPTYGYPPTLTFFQGALPKKNRFVSGYPTDSLALPLIVTFLWTRAKKSQGALPKKNNITSYSWDLICLPKHDVIMQLMHNESKYL